MSRRTLITCLLALAAMAALAGAPGALAAKRSGPAPVITKVAPMRVSVGATLTISGRHFKSRARRNTVIFRGANGRSAFVKPRRASSRRLVVKIPASVARLLAVKNSSQRPTRLKLRVLSGKFSRFTSRRLSPVVVGAGAGGGGGGGGGSSTVCDSDSDHDNDLLPNSLEKDIGTDPCLADTDDDSMTDGWEYFAAKDLNVKAVPYPGRRPFPNALDPSDGKQGSTGHSAWDFDGDGLTSYEEYRAWRRTGSSFDAAQNSPLGYSDGTKLSRPNEAPTTPYPAGVRFYAGPAWHDDERDADADGLANWLESARGPSNNGWWAGFWAQPAFNVEPWPKTYFGHFDERPFADLDMTDGDVDGDTILDGPDDQDNDDFTNIQELYELKVDTDSDGNSPYPSLGGLFINAMNPCAPNQSSRTCDDYKPFE
jgi:hypothetical protein